MRSEAELARRLRRDVRAPEDPARADSNEGVVRACVDLFDLAVEDVSRGDALERVRRDQDVFGGERIDPAGSGLSGGGHTENGATGQTQPARTSRLPLLENAPDDVVEAGQRIDRRQPAGGENV